MRIQVSRKQIADNHHCIRVSYCSLQHLLTYATSQYYTAGTYGWNFDAYTFEKNGMNLCITTGYRGMVENCKNACTYAICKQYDTTAMEILADNSRDKRERLEKLNQEFLSVVFKPVLECVR